MKNVQREYEDNFDIKTAMLQNASSLQLETMEEAIRRAEADPQTPSDLKVAEAYRQFLYEVVASTQKHLNNLN